MNFYPPPPTIKAELYVRIPDDLRCIGKETEWRGGFARRFQDIFLEGPVADDLGNLYIVDIPFGRILKISLDKTVSVAVEWDGEPNGLAATANGDLVIADYKQVCFFFAFCACWCHSYDFIDTKNREYSNLIPPQVQSSQK